MVELLYEYVAEPIQEDHHRFYGHYHLSFNLETGKQLYRAEINQIFARNGLALELNDQGQIQRLLPEVIESEIYSSVFTTGDKILDIFLNIAREKYLQPRIEMRLEALEKLWDAWERLKSLENPDPNKKKESVELLLRRAASEDTLYQLLNAEALALTGIGNNFMIRHTEISKTPITQSEIIDYLFVRMFSLILLLLKTSKRLQNS